MLSTLRICLLMVVLVVTSYYAVLQCRVLEIDHPITQDEPGFVEITAAANPYTFDGVVTCGNVYGPAYAWWARPFTALVANPYLAHRWASSAALFGLLALLGASARRLGAGRIETAGVIAIVYILNVSSHSLAASADLLGAALYFAALFVSRRGTWPALLGGLVLSAAATLTKPYFALAWLIIASHAVLFLPPRRALAYLGVSAAFGLAVLGLLQVFMPYYFFSTFVVQLAVAGRSPHVLADQLREFSILAIGLLLLAVLHRPIRRTLHLAWREPPIAPAIDLWSWAAIVAAVMLVTVLGWHAGNYLVYFNHLLLSPLAVIALARSREQPESALVLLGINLLVLGYLLPPQPRNDNWAALKAEVASVPGPVLGDPWLLPLGEGRTNLEVFSHGQSAGVLQVLDNAGDAIPARYAPLARDLTLRASRLAARIRAGEFDAVFTSYINVGGGEAWAYDQRHYIAALRQRYTAVSEVLIYPYGTPYWNRMHHGLEPCHVIRWERRPMTGTAAMALAR